MSCSIRITRQAFCRTDWLTYFLKIWFQEHTHHTHTHTTHTTKSLRYFTKWRMVNIDIHSSLFTISMFFLYIFNNYFNKYFRFHKDTNAVVQMLQAFQVSELQYPAYTSDYKHGCHESIHIQTVYTRQISKSSDLWLYVRSDTLYRKTRIINAFLQSIRFFRLAMLQTPFLHTVCTQSHKRLIVIYDWYICLQARTPQSPYNTTHQQHPFPPSQPAA